MSQFESIDRALKKGRLDLLKERKIIKKLSSNSGSNNNSSDDSNVLTDTGSGERKDYTKNKRYVKNPNSNNNTPVDPSKYNRKKLLQSPEYYAKQRLKAETGRKFYNLKPDSKGMVKPTKASVLGSVEKNIKKSSTPPKPGAKASASQLKKYNQQMRKSMRYSGNENANRVKKILARVAKNQKIDKSKAGLVQRMKDISYGKNPYKPKFGSVNLNLQKKYDDMMIKYGGKVKGFKTPDVTVPLAKPKVTTNFNTVNKGFKNAIKNKKGIAKILSKIPKKGKIGLALAGGALLYGALKGDKKKPDGGPITIPVNKKNYKMVPVKLTLQSKPKPLPNPAINPSTKKEYTPAQGGQPQSKFNKFIAKTAQTKSNPNLYKPKNTPKPPTTSTSAFNPNYDASKVASQSKPAQYGSTFTYKDKKTGEMKTGSKLTTKIPKNINKNLP